MTDERQEMDYSLADTEVDEEVVPHFDLTPETPDQDMPVRPESSPSPSEGQLEGERSQHMDTPSVQPVQFMPFQEMHDDRQAAGSNIDLLMDVPLPVVVELGHTTMQVKEILSLGPGSIIELDKAAGENVDILVNGRLIARGEVVVIEENFGVRIVEFISAPEKAVQQ